MIKYRCTMQAAATWVGGQRAVQGRLTGGGRDCGRRSDLCRAREGGGESSGGQPSNAAGDVRLTKAAKAEMQVDGSDGGCSRGTEATATVRAALAGRWEGCTGSGARSAGVLVMRQSEGQASKARR